ncbi:hypothetical protein AAJP47_00375 [Psychrobacter sp. B38]|uniref:hypothetical protein n=1 Tax=Psychrobacter sp. B38 TaxID=3143538 RepID=UPI0032108908
MTHPFKTKLSLLKSSLLGLTLTMALAGCSYLPNAATSDNTPTSPATSPSKLPAGFTQCPPSNANAKDTICTMQYDPVCVKTKVGSVISYRTAGNACSACGTPEAIGYVKGECK